MPPERRHARAQQACAYCRQRKVFTLVSPDEPYADDLVLR